MHKKFRALYDENKPYNICLSCPHLGTSCDGPNFLAMSFERWVEWCTIRADQLDMTHADIAAQAGIAKGTVDSILSGRSGDVRRETMAAITHALTGDCWGQYPCHDLYTAQRDTADLADDLNDANEEISRLKAELEKQEGSRTRQVDFLREEIAARDRRIDIQNKAMSRHEKHIIILAVACGFLALLIIASLAADAFLSGIGWIRG